MFPKTYLLLLFFLVASSCQPEIKTLTGSCSLGDTRTFVAPNGEHITASVDSIGWLRLTGNLNLVPQNLEIKTNMRDTIFQNWEARFLNSQLEDYSFQLFLQVEGASTFHFQLPYLQN